MTISVILENDAKINSCFYNVQRKIDRDGGSTPYGWAIRFSLYIIEAEKHATWKSPTGAYIDVTPTLLKSDNVYFVIDEDFQYNGQVVDNLRKNVDGNKVVDDWIAVSETIHHLYSFGHRTGEHELKIPESIAQAIQSLEKWANVFAPFLSSGGTYESTCFCGKNYPTTIVMASI